MAQLSQIDVLDNIRLAWQRSERWMFICSLKLIASQVQGVATTVGKVKACVVIVEPLRAWLIVCLAARCWPCMARDGAPSMRTTLKTASSASRLRSGARHRGNLCLVYRTGSSEPPRTSCPKLAAWHLFRNQRLGQVIWCHLHGPILHLRKMKEVSRLFC